MSTPLTIRFATDTTAAKAGIRDLSASVATNMGQVTESLNRSGTAVESARRGATSIAAAYVAGSRAAQAAVASLAITTTGMSLGSGRALSMLSGTVRMGSADFGQLANTASESGSKLQQLSSQFNIMEAPVRSFMEGLAIYDAVKRTWTEFSNALEDVEVRIRRLTALSDTSKSLGISPTLLSGLASQAKELRVETDSLVSMLTNAREATRVRIGEGKDAVNQSPIQARLTQHISAGNLSQEDVAPYNAAKTQEEQYRAILDLVQKLKSESRDLAANDVGRSFFGADFEAKTRQGIDMVGAFRNALDGAKAAGSGLAPTPEEIARAEEFRQREEAIAKTITDAIAPAVHDFNTLSDAGHRTWIEWEERVAGWVKWLGEGYLKVRDIAFEVKKMAQDWGLLKEDESQPLVVPVRIGGKGKPKVDQSKPLPPQTTKAPREREDPDSVANVIRGLEKARDVAKAELDTVGMSNVERARAVDLAKAEAAAREDVQKGVRDNAALTEEERRRVLGAADATAQFRDRQKDLEQQLRTNAETARYFGDALASSIGDAVLEGKSLGDVLMSLEKQLAKSALQAIFSGQGPLASLLGTAPAASQGGNAVGGLAGMVASAFRANGGPVTAGRPYTVGEMGQEIFVPDSNGRVMPISRGGFGGMGGPSVQILDQRTMAAPAPEVRRGPGGSTQILLRDLEGAIGQRAMRGQGAFAGAVSGPGNRRG